MSTNKNRRLSDLGNKVGKDKELAKKHNKHKYENKDAGLPGVDENGKAITYDAYDIDPPSATQSSNGQTRGKKRLIIGSDGKKYYSSDHYKTFSQIK